MKKYFLFAMVLFMIFPITMKAAVCSNSDKAAYQSLAKNISVNYDYIGEHENATFQATFTNIPESFYIRNLNTNQIYSYTGSEMVIGQLEQGKNYRFGIYTTSPGCDNRLLYTHYATLPYYNPYYNDPLCTGIESYPYCNKWLAKKITYEEFKSAIEKYLKKDHVTKVEEEVKTIGLLDQLIEIYLKYYMFILPAIIILGIVIIKRYNKKQDLF